MNNTVPRRVIMEELQASFTHPTAAEVYAAVHRRVPRISLGTVYRNLNILADSGIIMRLKGSGRQTRFDGHTEPHYHLICERCGAIEDFTPGVELTDSLSHDLKTCIGGRVHAFKLEFRGLCRLCAIREENGRKSASESEHKQASDQQQEK